MSEKRFQKTRIVDKWGGIYDSETDKVLNVNDVEHKLNEQQATNSALRTENNHLIDVIKEYAKKYEEQQATINKLQEENASLKQRIKDIKYNNCD